MSTSDESDFGSSNGTPSGALEERSQVNTAAARPAFSIDDIMWRVRAEVKRRRRGHLNGVRTSAGNSEMHSFDLSIPSWEPAIPRLPGKDTYHLSELLVFSDADFIDTAFRAIFRRRPDQPGFSHFLLTLRTGGLTKIGILQTLLASPEGQSVGVRIEGMFLPSLLERWRKKRFVGPIIAWAHALLRLDSTAARQASSDAYRAQEIQELGRLVNEGTDELAQKIASLRLEVADRVKASKFSELEEKNALTMSQLSNLESEMRMKFQAFEEHLNLLNGSHESTAGSIQKLLSRYERAADTQRALDPFYAAFEDHFRGDRAVIRTRVEPYLALIREVGAGTQDAPVVDIGCGRGEWLELIRDSGLVGHGIEINRVFIDLCRARGLEITEGEAVQSLRAMPEGSVGAITAMHIIEHLPFEHAIALLDEMRRVLRPGGLIIVETPNPENLTVGHLWFYMDPTHRNPLPPQALRWIVEARGFSEVRIERLVIARELVAPPPLAADLPGADAINAILESMRVAADYAVIGKRSD